MDKIEASTLSKYLTSFKFSYKTEAYIEACEPRMSSNSEFFFISPSGEKLFVGINYSPLLFQPLNIKEFSLNSIYQS